MFLYFIMPEFHSYNRRVCITARHEGVMVNLLTYLFTYLLTDVGR